MNILELWIWKGLDAVSRTQWAVLGASLEDQNTKRNAGSRGPSPKTAEGKGLCWELKQSGYLCP